jgi:hypothetical protein
VQQLVPVPDDIEQLFGRDRDLLHAALANEAAAARRQPRAKLRNDFSALLNLNKNFR